MEYLSSFFEHDPYDWRVPVLWLSFVLMSLAAFGSLFWWICFHPETETGITHRGVSESGSVRREDDLTARASVDADKNRSNSDLGSIMDPEPPSVFVGPPSEADDLTELEGIDSEAAARLNAAGFCEFKQLQELSDEERNLLAAKLGLPAFNVSMLSRVVSANHRKKSDRLIAEIEREKNESAVEEIDPWIPPAAEGMSKTTTEAPWPSVPAEREIRRHAAIICNWRTERGITGTSQDDWILAERELFRAACGLPGQIDRSAFYEKSTNPDLGGIDGITPDIADELGRLGFPNAGSIVMMSQAEEIRVQNWLRARGYELDLNQLRSSLSTGQG